MSQTTLSLQLRGLGIGPGRARPLCQASRLASGRTEADVLAGLGAGMWELLGLCCNLLYSCHVQTCCSSCPPGPEESLTFLPKTRTTSLSVAWSLCQL